MHSFCPFFIQKGICHKITRDYIKKIYKQYFFFFDAIPSKRTVSTFSIFVACKNIVNVKEQFVVNLVNILYLMEKESKI